VDKKLENIDAKIIAALSERFTVYIEALKNKGDDAELFSAAERAELFAYIDTHNEGPLSNEVLRKVYTEMISQAVDAVRPQAVAYLGPAGTFTHTAMLEIFGESARPLPRKTIHEVFAEVEAGRASFGVVPIENSTEGAVTYTLDELMETDLKITAEKSLRVSYSLLSVNTDLGKIRKLYTHPQSFGQCKEWIRVNLPDAEFHSMSSTSLAAEAAAWDKFAAAISSEASAGIYKLNVLASNIEDSKQNYTRFFVIGRNDGPPTAKDKTSIICAVKDKPGALYSLLRPFADAGINMTKIESRPDKKKMWEYNFFIDFIGHRDTTLVKNVMEKMKEDLVFLKVLGSYPAEN
jgi:chorismate mutase/prephenate dehydratase